MSTGWIDDAARVRAHPSSPNAAATTERFSNAAAFGARLQVIKDTGIWQAHLVSGRISLVQALTHATLVDESRRAGSRKGAWRKRRLYSCR